MAEIEKTNQIEYKRLRNIIESIEGEGTNNRNSNSRGTVSKPENEGRRARFVAQEDSSVNNLKDLKFDSKGVPNKPKVKIDSSWIATLPLIARNDMSKCILSF